MPTPSRIRIVCVFSAVACGFTPGPATTDGSSTGSGDTEPSPVTSATSPSTSSTTATTDTTTDAATDDTTGPGGSVSTSLDDGSDSSASEAEGSTTTSADDTTTTGLLAPCVDEDLGSMVGQNLVVASTVNAADDFKLAECFSPGPATTGADDTEGAPPPDPTSGTDTGIIEFFGDDYVLQWTPPETFVYTISITDADFDNIVGVYPPMCASKMYSCNDDCYGIDAGLQFVGTEGEPVFIVVDGRNGAVGSFSLSIEQGAGVCGGEATTG